MIYFLNKPISKKQQYNKNKQTNTFVFALYLVKLIKKL